MTVGFLYGAGADPNFRDRHLRKITENFCLPTEKPKSAVHTQKPRKIGVWVSGAEIQTSAVDTRTAIWVSAAEKIFKIVLGETRKIWGRAKGAMKRACGKTVVQRPKNGQQQVVNQKPAARLPRKDSHFSGPRPPAIPDSVC